MPPWLGACWPRSGSAAATSTVAARPRRPQLASAEAGGHYAARVVGRSVLAIAAARSGDFSTEKSLYEERLILARDHGDRVRVADTLTVLGEIGFDDGDYPTATAFVREAFELSDGHSRPESRDALIMLGRIALADRDPERAVGFLNEALLRAVDVGQPAALAQCVRALAATAVVQGDAERAARLFGAGDTLQPTFLPVNPNVERDLTEHRTTCRALLGDAGFDREYQLGATMDVARALEVATRAVTSVA